MAIGAALAMHPHNEPRSLFPDILVCMCIGIGDGRSRCDVLSAFDGALVVLETLTDEPLDLNGVYYNEGELALVVLTTEPQLNSCLDKVRFVMNQTFEGWSMNHGETAHLVTPHRSFSTWTLFDPDVFCSFDRTMVTGVCITTASLLVIRQ